MQIDSSKNLIILGSNGVGKTTLAKLLCGLISNDEVSIDDKIFNQLSKENRTKYINYIPAKLEVFDEFLSVKEFLELSCLYAKNSVQEVLERLEIGHLENQPCQFLSSGESQLLLLASAVLHNALFSILDEPTSNLDPMKVKMVYAILKDEDIFQSKIIITHNLDLAYKLGYDIVFLQEGRVAFEGSSAEFFAAGNLQNFFANSVKKLEDNIVVDL